MTFAVGPTLLLIGITYGIEPYRGQVMGWSNPWVIGALVIRVVLLVLFIGIELRVSDPMFHLGLFKIRMIAAGNVSSLLVSIARGGLQLMLIIWLQGIWLPLYGYCVCRDEHCRDNYLTTALYSSEIHNTRKKGRQNWR